MGHMMLPESQDSALVKISAVYQYSSWHHIFDLKKVKFDNDVFDSGLKFISEIEHDDLKLLIVGVQLTLRTVRSLRYLSMKICLFAVWTLTVRSLVDPTYSLRRRILHIPGLSL